MSYVSIRVLLGRSLRVFQPNFPLDHGIYIPPTEPSEHCEVLALPRVKFYLVVRFAKRGQNWPADGAMEVAPPRIRNSTTVSCQRSGQDSSVSVA